MSAGTLATAVVVVALIVVAVAVAVTFGPYLMRALDLGALAGGVR